MNELLAKIRKAENNKQVNLTFEVGNSLSINLENISFRHSNSKETIINKLSYVFDEGVHLINGKNGTGKTTLINILGGIRHQTDGKLTINLPEIFRTPDYENNCIKVVQQTPFLFDDSVWNNLQIVHPDLTFKTLYEYLEFYGFTDMYNKISGYKSIGTNGSNLSGGEKQMISILRAVISDPPILLLDEISNHLSRSIKEHVLVRITGLRKNKITIIVSHQDIGYLNFSSILNLDEERLIKPESYATA